MALSLHLGFPRLFRPRPFLQHLLVVPLLRRLVVLGPFLDQRLELLGRQGLLFLVVVHGRLRSLRGGAGRHRPRRNVRQPAPIMLSEELPLLSPPDCPEDDEAALPRTVKSAATTAS